MDAGRLHSQQARGSYQLQQVLPIIFQGTHRTAEAQLACFRSSKGMAEAVLQHAAETCLTLTPGDGTAAEGSDRRCETMAATAGSSRTSSISTSSVRQHQTAAQRLTAQQLAAESDKVTLSLHDNVLTPAACLWQRITTIVLCSMPLDQISTNQLELHRLPRLHTLRFLNCQLDAASISTSKQHRSTSVRTLEWDAPGHPFPAAAFELVDPAQLQTVIIDHASITNVLPQLPALQQLRISDAVAGHADVYSTEFQLVLDHPRLARVQLADVRLWQSLADKPCKWESLDLTAGMSLSGLACMPLAGIRSCTVHGMLWAPSNRPGSNNPDKAQAALATISRIPHPRLVFQPCSSHERQSWYRQNAGPTFEVHCGVRQDGRVSAQLIDLAIKHLVPDAALVLRDVQMDAPEVLASLAAAPASLTTLGLFDPVSSSGGVSSELYGVMARMPHITHVMLIGHRRLRWSFWLEFLLAGVSRPLQISICSQEQAWHFRQDSIRELVAEEGNEHMHVNFWLG